MTTATATTRFLTPPQIGRQLGISPEKVIGFIRRGELRAVDVSNHPGIGKPRFRVDPIELEAFLLRRSATPAPKAKRRRRRDPAIIEFF